MDKHRKFSLISSIISASLCALLLIFSVFAWYVTNSTAEATGLTGVTSENHSIHFTNSVTAVRYSLNGDITTNTYTRSSTGELTLTTSVFYDASDDTTTTTTSGFTSTKFAINELLPGEYVDITIGYFVDAVNDGKDYSVSLKSISADSFDIAYNEDGQTRKHYASGAFKYKSISLKDSNDQTPSDFTADTDSSWITTYDINSNDTLITQIKVLEHTWDNDYGTLYYTFRIEEDFTQYYSLIAASPKSYANVLSTKNFNIGMIFLQFD